jgi:hypothetical protein
MTIPFEVIKAELLANPEVKREYDALAPEFEAYAKSCGRGSVPQRKRPTHAASSSLTVTRRPRAEAILTSAYFLLFSVPHRRCRPTRHETVAPASRPAVAWSSWSTLVSH